MRALSGASPRGWTDGHRALRVAIVGATGAVGRELAQILLAEQHPRANLRLLARRHGTIVVAGIELTLESTPQRTDDAWARDFDVVFLCTPTELSAELGPTLAARGVLTIDNSSAFRLHASVPLVVPEINAYALTPATKLVANPNCTAAIACLPLAVIDRLAGLEEVVVVSYQAASGAGVAGLEALAEETRVAAGLAPSTQAARSPFAALLALNVIPGVAEPDASGFTGEEQKIVDESRKILGHPDLVIEATTARVPVERCHSMALHVKTTRVLATADLVRELRGASGIVVVDDPHGPRPRECAGLDPVFVGRIRAGTRGPRSLCFFAVGDQLRKGAALNALQIAAALSPRSILAR